MPRLHCSLAFCDADGGWYLANATPDVTHQMSRWPELHARGTRQAPVRGVFLTDAELDHVLGLFHLREGTPWTLYATRAVLRLLREDLRLLPALERYNEVQVHPLTASGMELPGVEVRLIETSRRRPRYARGGEEGLLVVAVLLTDRTTGRSLVYAPGVAELSDSLRVACATASVVLFDGTFFTDDEPVRMGVASENARAMGHVPVSGPDGSACWLADLPAPHKLYVHVNNTNPLLDPASEARTWIRSLGLEVADDGWEVAL